jgi:hypothetical protein
MKRSLPPLEALLPRTIPFEIPAYWTPEQALAVVELLDDLRERIVAHYSWQLTEAMRQAYSTSCGGEPPGNDADEEPF